MAGEENQQVEENIEPVEVTIVDETAEAAAAPAAPAAAAPKEAEKPRSEDPVLDLKDQYEALRRRAETAESRASAAEAAARTAAAQAEQNRSISVEAQMDSVIASLDGANAELENAQRELKEAAESADFARQAEASAKIGKLGYRIGRLEEVKGELEARKDKPSAPPPQPVDPIEAFAQGRTKPSADWIRSHPDFVLDPRKNAKLTAAHYDAVGDGLQADTPEYFDHIERRLGLKTDAAETTQPKPAAPAQRKPAQSFVAPVGASPNGASRSPRQVQLNRAEAAAATDGTHVWNYDDPSPQKRFKKGDPIGVNEFARRKSIMQSQGAYDRTYTDE